MSKDNSIHTKADFFISFSGQDKKWADWIAWTLDELGYAVIYQPWDFAPGTNFVLEMNKAIGSEKTIAIISNNYLNSKFTQTEWAAAFARDPDGYKRKLIPIRIEECNLKDTLLAQIVYIDLAGVFDNEIAKKVILEGLKGKKPSEAPEVPFPREKAPPFPGTIADPATRSSVTDLGITMLPPPGIKIPFSQAYTPPTFRGVQIHTENPFVLDFILDSGDSNLSLRDLGEVSLRLTKYFLTALTVPDDHLWVNLSPVEAEEIIPKDLSQTQMGIDLLVQDYVLKQVTATAFYPEKKIGSEYWNRVYTKSGGNIDQEAVNTINKVWVTPKSARIIEKGAFAVVKDSKLQVQTENDYLAAACLTNDDKPFSCEVEGNEKLATSVFKETILPLIEADVNKGGNFAVLRQIFSSLVLSVWYKEVLKRSIVNDLYIDRGITSGVGCTENSNPAVIYEQYLNAFQAGVFEYIREDIVGSDDELIPRKYFSGGFTGAHTREKSVRKSSDKLTLESESSTGNGALYWVRLNLCNDDKDFIDDHYYDMDNVGGIDLSVRGSFDFKIESENELRFNLSDEISDRIKSMGMGKLKPSVMFVKKIKGTKLEVSQKTNLSELLEEVSDKKSKHHKNNIADSSDGFIKRIQKAWGVLFRSDK